MFTHACAARCQPSSSKVEPSPLLSHYSGMAEVAGGWWEGLQWVRRVWVVWKDRPGVRGVTTAHVHDVAKGVDREGGTVTYLIILTWRNWLTVGVLLIAVTWRKGWLERGCSCHLVVMMWQQRGQEGGLHGAEGVWAATVNLEHQQVYIHTAKICHICSLIHSSDLHDTISIDLESNFDLRNATRHWWDSW